MGDDENVTLTTAEEHAINALRKHGVEVKPPYIDDGEITVSAYKAITGGRGCTMLGWGKTVAEALLMLEEKCVAAASIADAFRKARAS